MVKSMHFYTKNQIIYIVAVMLSLIQIDMGVRKMDFEIIDRIENGENCYKLLRALFYREHYVIIAQNKTDFCCGSIRAGATEAHRLFCEIASTETPPFCLADILCDFDRQAV